MVVMMHYDSDHSLWRWPVEHVHADGSHMEGALPTSSLKLPFGNLGARDYNFIWGSHEKSHKSSTPKETRVPLAACFACHKWRACLQSSLAASSISHTSKLLREGSTGKLPLPHCRPWELICDQTLRGLGVGKTLPLQTTTPRIDRRSNYFGGEGVG